MNQQDRERFDNFDKKLDDVSDEVRDIKNNHLAHIYERLGNLAGIIHTLRPFIIGLVGGVVILIIGMALQFAIGG